jgi:hypothetical protein
MSTLQERVEIKINRIIDKIIDIIFEQKYSKYFTYPLEKDLIHPIELDSVHGFCYIESIHH